TALWRSGSRRSASQVPATRLCRLVYCGGMADVTRTSEQSRILVAARLSHCTSLTAMSKLSLDRPQRRSDPDQDGQPSTSLLKDSPQFHRVYEELRRL